MIPSTTDRVPMHTAEHVNEQIRLQTEENIRRYAGLGPEAIDRRLKELDDEWDIERQLEANAASVVLIGSVLGATVHKGFFAIPAMVGGFLLQHAVQGWCPPLPVLRRMGFRTAAEIERERRALEEMRDGGHFNRVEGHFRQVAEMAAG